MVRSRPSVRTPHAIAAALLHVVTACTPRPDPSLLPREDAGRQGDGGAVVLRKPPPRPSGPDGDDGREIAVALRSITLNHRDAWSTTGLDLDGLATSVDDPVSECLREQTAVDGEDGIDNVFGAEVFPLLEVTIPGVEESMRASLDSGQSVTILRLRGWNGTADDARVDVAWLPSVRVTASGSDFGAPPVWDGTDEALVREDALFGADLEQPLVRDDNAYVAGGVLVLRLPDRAELQLAADDASLQVRLTGATILAQVDTSGAMPLITLTGRWSIIDFMRTAEGVGVCRGTSEYNVLDASLRRSADVRSEPGSGGDGVACDAISVAITFVGTPVLIGPVWAPEPLASQCSG